MIQGWGNSSHPPSGAIWCLQGKPPRRSDNRRDLERWNRRSFQGDDQYCQSSAQQAIGYQSPGQAANQRPQSVPLLLARRLAPSRVPQSVRCREIWERVRRWAPAPVWLQVGYWTRECRCCRWLPLDARQRRSLMSVRAPRSNGLRLTERLEAGRPSRGAGAPHHWRSTRTFC